VSSIQTLLKAFRYHVSHYHAELPYNLNWQITPKDRVADALTLRPIRVMDIGARGGEIPELNSLNAWIDYTAFDADEAEANRLANSSHGYAAYRIFPYFIGETSSAIPFYLYQNLGESSCLLPNPGYQRGFQSTFTIKETVTVATQSLDTVIAKHELPFPDLLKIDVQGMALPVLKGAYGALGLIPLIEVECEFFQMYKDQSLAYDVGQYLSQNGYVTLYLNRVMVTREGFSGLSRGQLMFSDILFGLSIEAAGRLQPDSLDRYCLLLIHYGHRDFAAELITTYPAILERMPGISELLSARPKRVRWLRILLMQIDKLVALLLWLRGTNQLAHDSDRSWPIR